ncbi:MAG: T9SS type A sorting domain-containing protein [Sphingobacteriales bacterium]|nr:MAG: T9SS type A sorting domain-containing protein [Sphingobacteriales bacterium]
MGGGNVLMGQPLDFCGLIEKPPLQQGQTARFYDRFGNAYTEEEVRLNYYPLAFKSDCESGHFDLYFEGTTWSDEEQETICQVFADLSDLIISESDLPVDILVNKMELTSGVAGTGSPFWEAECGMANSLILDRLNNTYLTSYPAGYFLGELRISNLYAWHTLDDDLPTDDFDNPTIAANYLDLYSIALHEALHILGFASRISVNGTPLLDGDFYSRWDRFIYSKLEEDYLLQHNPSIDCCDDYTFNETDFPDMPDDLASGCNLKLAFKNADDVIIAPVNVGAYTTFTGGNGPSFFLNKLSHLDFGCATNLGLSPALKYVMHYEFDYAEARRVVTAEEQQILCALGYHLVTEESCPQNCEVFTNPDSYQIFLQGTAANNPLIFDLTDNNSITANDIIPEGADISIVTDCGFIGDLNVTLVGTTLTITATSTGIFYFCYTVVSCDGICQTEIVTVVVKNEPIETVCDDPYCNIVCFGDFEEFNYNDVIYDGLNVPEIQFDGRISSPHITDYDENNQLLIAIAGTLSAFDWDATPIPLSKPIPIGCEVVISFNATALYMYLLAWGNDPDIEPTIQFTALSDYPPCSSFPFPDCTSDEFFLCGSTITATNMNLDPCGLPINYQAIQPTAMTAILDAIDFNNLPFYSFTWINTTGTPINTLLLNVNSTIGSSENAGLTNLFIDNLKVTLECEEHISISADDIDDVCPGSIVTIPYTICLETPETGPFDLVSVFLDADIESLPGVSVVNGSGVFNNFGQTTVDFDPNTNLCTTVDLNLNIGSSFTVGQEIIINMQAINSGTSGICISGNGAGINVVLTIIECEPTVPPYDCLDITNFFTVNAGTQDVYILSEFGENRNSYSPPATATWQPGSHPFTAITGSSTDLSFNVDLVIPNGIELAINDMNLFFAPDKRILVQPGGSLSIENTVIDGVCEVMWTGVQVQGPGIDITPSPSNAGKFDMYESQVLHAILGVVNMNLAPLNNTTIANTSPPDNPYINVSSISLPVLFSDSPARATSGGIISINHSNFKGCFQDINVSWNNNINYSFTHNDFLTESAGLWYPFNNLIEQPEAGIHATWCNRIVVLDCYSHNHKYGIRANHVAHLLARDNFFEENQVGISARNFKNAISQVSIIETNNFQNCRLSVQADGNDLCKLIGNKVNDTGNSIDFYNPLLTASFYLRGSNILATNNFLHNTNMGIIINQSDMDGSIIAGNLVNNTQQAIIVEGDNSATWFWCNHLLDYAHYGLDLRAFYNSNGVLPQQGDCDLNLPAANTFVPYSGEGVFGVMDIRLGPAVGGFEVNSIIYNDVNATELIDEDLSAIGDYEPENCFDIGLNEFCSDQGYTPISDVTEYFGIDAMTDLELAELVLRLLTDSNYIDALSLLHEYNEYLLAQRRLVPHYIAIDSIEVAQNLLNLIDAETEENLRFVELNQLLIDLRNDNRTIFEITNAEEDQLLDIAESGTKTSYKAQTLLYLAKTIEFPVELPALANGGDNWYTSFKNWNNQSLFRLYPNPTTQTAFINCTLSKDEEAILTIYNSIGKRVSTNSFKNSGTFNIDVHHFTSGLYFYTVSLNGKTIFKDKLVILN